MFLGNVALNETGSGLAVSDAGRGLWLIGDGDALWAVDQFGEVKEILLDATDIAAPHPFFDQG